MLKNIHPIQIGTYELNLDKELIYAYSFYKEDYLVTK